MAGERADDDILRPLIRDARRMRFECATAPLAFNDAVIRQRLSTLNYEAVARKVSLVYPSLIAESMEVAHALEDVLGSGENPLLDTIESLGGRNTALVLRKARLAEAVRAALSERAATRQMEVVDLESVRAMKTFARLIVCGPAHWFPDYVFSAPRACELHVVSYQWQRSQWEQVSPFLASASHEGIPKAIARDETEAWPELNWNAISRNAIEGSRDEDGTRQHELVETRLFLLSGGLGVFLDYQSSSLVIDVEAEGSERVRRISSDDIEPGTYLLLRTEGGGDYIVSLADQVLGDLAAGHRAMQRHWKERLRQVVSASPEADVRSRLIDVSLRLIELGATRADEGNLRNWMSTRNIRTRDKEHFHAIMELVGLGAETDQYWIVMRQILAAHHQAGRRIRRRLLERVRAVDVPSLQHAGRIDFALPEEEGGKLCAFLVEGRAPNRYHVPSARESTLFERED